MKYTLHYEIYLKAVKSNKYTFYFDLVVGIKETPGALLFPISSDKMIDFFSVEMKACFNYFENYPDNHNFQAIRESRTVTRKIILNSGVLLYVSVCPLLSWGRRENRSNIHDETHELLI